MFCWKIAKWQELYTHITQLMKKQSQMLDHNSKMLDSAPIPISHGSLSPPTKTNFMAQSLYESL